MLITAYSYKFRAHPRSLGLILQNADISTRMCSNDVPAVRAFWLINSLFTNHIKSATYQPKMAQQFN